MQNHISIKTFIAIKTCIKPLLAAAIALFLLPQLALPSQASDLTYKTEYYRPPTPPFTRIPRSANSGAFVTLSGSSVNAGGITGTPHQVSLYSDCTKTINNDSYVLVSATLSGGVEGVAQAYPDPVTCKLPQFVPVWVGNNPIVVTYVYLPTGSGPCTTTPCGGGSSAVLDEESDVTGALLDDLFVEDVFQPQTATGNNAAVTHDANYLGVIDTTHDSSKIVAWADPHNPATNAPTDSIFDRWVSSVSDLHLAQGARDLNLASGQGGYFIANYRRGCPANYHFVPSATLSACKPDDCKADQVWDAAKNACVAPSCPAGEKCEPFTCPKTCPNGCIVVPPETAFNKTSKPVFACKNAQGGIGTPIPQ
jgi:hypothetical protein